MSGTRKLEKFELELLVAAAQKRTQKVERFVTPLAEPSPAILAAARPSVVPDEPVLADEPAARAAPAAPVEPTVVGPDERAPTSRTFDREPNVERLRTRLARKFTTLADDVTDGFADFHIGAGAWTAELTAPEGMSTAGGKAALQHLRLRPTRQGYTVVVGGVVNPVTMSAELRDYEHMATLYRARFGAVIAITAGEWEQFLRKAEVVLREKDIGTTRVSAPRDVLMLTRDAGVSRQTLAGLALGVAVFLATIVAWRMIMVMSP